MVHIQNGAFQRGPASSIHRRLWYDRDFLRGVYVGTLDEESTSVMLGLRAAKLVRG